MLELLLKLLDNGASVIEVPMVLSSNKRVDRSKMKLFRTTMAYFRFSWEYRRRMARDL